MKDFILPDIGEGIVECELLKWLVAEGDVIKEDQPVAEVMTDKATVEIPAMHDGVIKTLYYKEGDIAKVHAPLFAMEEAGEAVVEVQQPAPTQVASNNTRVESFVLPDIGEGIVECEIVKWSISEGDVVVEDQVVVEVMTDKAVVEIPAKHAGTILKLHYQQGDIAKVHSVLFDQEIASDASDAAQSSGAAVNHAASQSASSVAVNTTDNITRNHSKPMDSVTYKQGENFEAPIVSERPIASPAVRRLARERGIDLKTVKGSGKKGRIVKQDLSALPEQLATNAPAKGNETASNASPVFAQQGSDRVESIKGIRAAMAKQMMASVSTIPHFTVSDELCMDNLIALRSSLKGDFEKQGIKLSFMPFFIKALSLALNAFPVINSRLNDDATELTYLQSHNIGMAVDSKIGLLVPNIKNVEQKSLREVALDVNRIVDSAREGKLSNADLSGGTISISNIGAIGGITATPVINKPDVAIVALGKTQKLPRFADDGSVFAQNIMMVNWSGDHRVIDGATMVKFNNLWMDYLTHPHKMLVDLR
ncbi:dihydrolipoyllysine-residue acetyltransferase [Glaciecola sp. XM2]|jgi:2-oxoisovalerate dehydrogenase E2 component (dihydrolipoyl transacylase)|uniref:dihydrolipoyllysine-residue acetyltransferase n=1 Tax=Glaciecola sp. XM2 TaxID=1914931 RepID=UPI001BDE9E67|nr:dihydrolipoyllysine-residue acetyltransferase [Glaciecola sp. XM2]MBT1449536.1 dihydrolipoyllysine-residue acetyltransferase [Glaciecola sp. XM2]